MLGWAWLCEGVSEEFNCIEAPTHTQEREFIKVHLYVCQLARQVYPFDA